MVPPGFFLCDAQSPGRADNVTVTACCGPLPRAYATEIRSSPQETIIGAETATAATMLAAPTETGRVGMDARSFVAGSVATIASSRARFDRRSRSPPRASDLRVHGMQGARHPWTLSSGST